MSDNKDKVKGCVHPEDSWTNYGCGDCGDYANNNGCRGPRGRIDSTSTQNTINWVYQVILDTVECTANNIDLRSSYVKNIFFGIPLIKLGYGPKTVFQLYEEINGVPVYTEDNPSTIVEIPNETIKAMIPVKQIICKDI